MDSDAIALMEKLDVRAVIRAHSVSRSSACGTE